MFGFGVGFGFGFANPNPNPNPTQLVRSCGGLKGGALSVGIHRHERNGDPDVSTYVRHLLRQALS